MQSRGPVETDILLLGAGHAHVEVLRRLLGERGSGVSVDDADLGGRVADIGEEVAGDRLDGLAALAGELPLDLQPRWRASSLLPGYS